MKIVLDDIGRRFNRDWIFKGINYELNLGQSYVILGPNGSGKSTLLQILNGSLTPSTGKIGFYRNELLVDVEKVYQYLSLAAPYLELIEDFTLTEVIDFHFKFKPYQPGIDRTGIISLLGMESSKNKLVRYFSSGMKQRLKLALAFCSDTPLLMLDEPTSNLDTQGINWYLSLVDKFSANRLTVVCSNQEHEYAFCAHTLNMVDYK